MTDQQSEIFNTLMVFSKICESNNLKYFLVGGTLLGAVRHQGFIPWDDDIDVAMPQKDFFKFIELSKMLPLPYALQSGKTDSSYPFLFIKLCDTSHPFPHENEHGPIGCYIDIFPLSYGKPPTLLNRFKFNVANVISYTLQVKMGWTKNVPYKNIAAHIGYRFFLMLTSDQLKKIRGKLLTNLVSDAESKWIVSLAGIYKANKEFCKSEIFNNTALYTFENHSFPGPKDYKSYLAQMYGNYMQQPAKNKQISNHC